MNPSADVGKRLSHETKTIGICEVGMAIHDLTVSALRESGLRSRYTIRNVPLTNGARMPSSARLPEAEIRQLIAWQSRTKTEYVALVDVAIVDVGPPALMESLSFATSFARAVFESGGAKRLLVVSPMSEAQQVWLPAMALENDPSLSASCFADGSIAFLPRITPPSLLHFLSSAHH